MGFFTGSASAEDASSAFAVAVLALTSAGFLTGSVITAAAPSSFEGAGVSVAPVRCCSSVSPPPSGSSGVATTASSSVDPGGASSGAGPNRISWSAPMK